MRLWFWPTALALALAAAYQPSSEAPAGFDNKSNGAVDDAIAEYQLVLGLDPNNDVAHARLARMLIVRRRFDDAEAHARRAITLQMRSGSEGQMSAPEESRSRAKSKSTRAGRRGKR